MSDAVQVVVVFDAERPVRLKLLTEEATKREIMVRFPTDDELVAWQRSRRLLVKHLGRGVSETTVPNAEEKDLALFEKIATDDAQVDPFEANQIVKDLTQNDVDDVTKIPGGYRIALRVPGGITTHDVRVPTAKERFRYQRDFARALDVRHGRQELTLNLLAGAALYDAIVKASEGYEGRVPVNHKTAVAKAAIEEAEAATAGDVSEDDDENFRSGPNSPASGS